MEIFILLVMIFTVLLFPFASWVVDNYTRILTNKENRSFLLSLVVAVHISLFLTLLSTNFALKEILEVYK